MNALIRNILSSFASATAGAIIAILVATFLFGTHDSTIIKVFAFFGALFGALR